MYVKGTAFLARKSHLAQEFGEDRWEHFLAGLAAKDPFYKASVTALSRIPVESFLALCDGALATFYDGDFQGFWEMGRKSADWALGEGPYKHYREGRKVRAFVEDSVPSIWKIYFSDGSLDGKVEGASVRIGIHGLRYRHPYFEFLVMGYAKRAFELMGEKVTVTKVHGFADEGADIEYLFGFGAPIPGRS